MLFALECIPMEKTFKTGIYVWSNGLNSTRFGNETYESLAATAAAKILDREASSLVIDAGLTHENMK